MATHAAKEMENLMVTDQIEINGQQPNGELIPVETSIDVQEAHLMEDSQFLLAFPELKAPPMLVEPIKEADRYTGEKVKRDRPDIYDYCLRALADPRMSYRRITALTGVKFYILKWWEWEDGKAIACNRKALASKWGCVSDMAAEKLMQLLPDSKSVKEVSVAGGIGSDKYLQLSGEPTQRIQFDAKIDINAAIGDLKKIFDEADARGKEIKQAQGRVIENNGPESNS
jgi:hypothetical protein